MQYTLIVILAMSVLPAGPRDERETSVGLPGHIEQLVLPGSELEATPLEDVDAPLVLRVAAVFRHGSDHRYDLVYYGLEPGSYDLRDYLRRKDGGPADDLPPILVEVHAVLPPGQIEPNRTASRPSPGMGGYRMAMWLAGALWVAGLLAILLVGRGRAADAQAAAQGAISMADRLRPLVERAQCGQLSTGEKAELERLLLGFWRRRLALEQADAARAMQLMREHEEAGALLRQLEQWLHDPGDSQEADVTALLEPYRKLPADAPDDVAPNDDAPKP